MRDTDNRAIGAGRRRLTWTFDEGAKVMLPSANDDLRRRRWIWQALSDLFLDDEITDDTLRYAARIGAECGYSEEELEAIYREEVAPALAFNYFDVAGVWGYFDSVWLQERIVRPRGVGCWIDRWILAPLVRRGLRRDWERLKGMFSEEQERIRKEQETPGSRWKPCCAEEAPSFRWQGAEQDDAAKQG